MRSPSGIAENYVSLGQIKCEMSVWRMFILGVFAGMFVAFAGAGSSFANVYANRFAGAVIFSAGLAMVLIAGSELFTGNSLIIISVLERRVSLLGMLKNWLFVYLGNFAGALFVAALAVFSGTLDGISEAVVSTAAAKTSLEFGPALMKAILCNVLVCIAVWMSFAADTVSGKIIAVIFPISVFVICGFEHSVANMYFIPAGMFAALKNGIAADGLNVFNMIIKNLLPVTLGNIIGGSAIVGFGYWLVYMLPKHKITDK